MTDSPTPTPDAPPAVDDAKRILRELEAAPTRPGRLMFDAELEGDDESDPAPPLEGFTLQQMPLRWSRRRGKLAAALAAAQEGIVPAVKDRTNVHLSSSYASLNAIREPARIPLARHGIAVVQGPLVDDTKVTVITQLVHGSGQWVECELTFKAEYMKGLNWMQVFGVVLSYARRYTLQMVTGVTVIEGDADDDDGNAVSTGPDDRGYGDRGYGDRGAPSTPPASRAAPLPKIEAPRSYDEMIKQIAGYTTDQLRELSNMQPFFKFKMTEQQHEAARAAVKVRVEAIRAAAAGTAPPEPTKAGKLAAELAADKGKKAAAAKPAPAADVSCRECNAEIVVNGLVIDTGAHAMDDALGGKMCSRCIRELEAAAGGVA